jgi:hypothetical protein
MNTPQLPNEMTMSQIYSILEKAKKNKKYTNYKTGRALKYFEKADEKTFLCCKKGDEKEFQNLLNFLSVHKHNDNNCSCDWCKNNVEDQKEKNQLIVDVFRAIYSKDHVKLNDIFQNISKEQRDKIVHSLISNLRGTPHWKTVTDMRYFPIDFVSPLEAAIVTEGAQECVKVLLKWGAKAKRAIYVDITKRLQYKNILTQYGCTEEDFEYCHPWINNLK